MGVGDRTIGPWLMTEILWSLSHNPLHLTKCKYAMNGECIRMETS
jgi:hypothetical protein